MTARKSHRYLSFAAAPPPPQPPPGGGDRFELEESDVWSADVAAAVAFLEPKMPASRRRGRKQPLRGAAAAARSLPVNIPDWSKILGGGGGEFRRRAAANDRDEFDCDYDYDYEEEGENDRIAPHEYLARNRGASFSVHEGEGRTLKGRDLSRVRNAIWKQIGFED